MTSQNDTHSCPVCMGEIEMGQQYDYNHPAHYDGVSVWICAKGHQWGRWTGRVLGPDDVEWPYGQERKKR